MNWNYCEWSGDSADLKFPDNWKQVYGIDLTSGYDMCILGNVSHGNYWPEIGSRLEIFPANTAGHITFHLNQLWPRPPLLFEACLYNAFCLRQLRQTE